MFSCDSILGDPGARLSGARKIKRRFRLARKFTLVCDRRQVPFLVRLRNWLCMVREGWGGGGGWGGWGRKPLPFWAVFEGQVRVVKLCSWVR